MWWGTTFLLIWFRVSVPTREGITVKALGIIRLFMGLAPILPLPHSEPSPRCRNRKWTGSLKNRVRQAHGFYGPLSTEKSIRSELLRTAYRPEGPKLGPIGAW